MTVNIILILHINSYTGFEVFFYLASIIAYFIFTEFLDLDDDNAEINYYNEQNFYFSTLGWTIFSFLIHYGFSYMFKLFFDDEEITDLKESILEEESKKMLECELLEESINLNICKYLNLL